MTILYSYKNENGQHGIYLIDGAEQIPANADLLMICEGDYCFPFKKLTEEEVEFFEQNANTDVYHCFIFHSKYDEYETPLVILGNLPPTEKDNVISTIARRYDQLYQKFFPPKLTSPSYILGVYHNGLVFNKLTSPYVKMAINYKIKDFMKNLKGETIKWWTDFGFDYK
ncbi:MAG: hypothetical protein N3A54_06260 [Patescibacteria group bacterium]|nr:hypothetical protein [Patescibacteria group bacterium]